MTAHGARHWRIRPLVLDVRQMSFRWLTITLQTFLVLSKNNVLFSHRSTKQLECTCESEPVSSLGMGDSHSIDHSNGKNIGKQCGPAHTAQRIIFCSTSPPKKPALLAAQCCSNPCWELGSIQTQREECYLLSH